MNREIKFRVWDGSKMIYAADRRNDTSLILNEWGWELVDHFKGTCESLTSSWENEKAVLMQYAGLKDKSGKEIYEGDILRYRHPIRTTQTHEGDNIPNGSYTEPMEAKIEEHIGEVKYSGACFYLDEGDGTDNVFPFVALSGEWTESEIKEAICCRGKEVGLWDDPREGDLQYLLSENKLENIEQLIEYLRGFEIIGNVFENTELINHD